MTIGERIKKIRVFRKMTMDGLGGALGFEGKNMSVRISQYETGARIPGDDMIQKLADALHCNYKAISDYSLGAAEDIIETLFWLEESASSLPARVRKREDGCLPHWQALCRRHCFWELM